MARSVGALALSAQKYGGSRLKRPKVWELSLYTARSVGALALNAQKYGSYRFKRPKVIKSLGALALNARNVWELLL